MGFDVDAACKTSSEHATAKSAYDDHIKERWSGRGKEKKLKIRLRCAVDVAKLMKKMLPKHVTDSWTVKNTKEKFMFKVNEFGIYENVPEFLMLLTSGVYNSKTGV